MATSPSRDGARSDQTLQQDTDGALWVTPHIALLERVGQGGGGAVYRALEVRQQKVLAVKLVKRESTEAHRRFEREASALAALAHPGIVRYHSHGAVREDLAWLAMDWIEGQSLESYLAAHGRLVWTQAVRLVRQIADAMGAAHAAGLLHRDLKPGNIMLEGASLERPKVVDFGIARALGRERETERLTHLGTVLGTPGYMAPEQARGAAELTPAVDVFSLGAVLYECLVGERAFGGDTVLETLSKLLLEEAPEVGRKVPELPEGLGYVVQSALAREALQRPRDCYALARALAPWDAHGAALESEVLRTRTWTLRAARSPALMLAIFADTNRWNRVLGSPKTEYVYDHVPGERVSPPRKLRIGQAMILGAQQAWLEQGEWLEGEFVDANRVFRDGPFARIGYTVRAKPEGQGCRLELRLELLGKKGLPEDFVVGLLAAMEQRLEPYFQAVLALAEKLDEPDGATAPALIWERALLAEAPGKILGGRVTAVEPLAWERVTRAFRNSPIAHELQQRLLAFLSEAPDDQVARIRPFELATAWRMSPRRVLRALLWATHHGLCELAWSVQCPVCRVGTQGRGHLQDLGAHSHCPECQLDFETDFASNTELTLRVHPSVRAVREGLQCAGSLMERPHVFAELRLPPHSERTLELQVPRSLLDASVQDLGPARACPECSSGMQLRVVVQQDGWELMPLPARDSPAGTSGTMHLRLENRSDYARVLKLERRASVRQLVQGLDLATMPELYELLGDEAPAPGTELKVSRLVVLAARWDDTELLYEMQGDTRAWKLLQQRLEGAARCVNDHGGALFRTDDDGFLASFAQRTEAARAAAALLRTHAAAEKLRLAIVEGACRLVRQGQGLGYFGSALRVGRKLAHESPELGLSLAPELCEDKALEATLESSGLSPLNRACWCWDQRKSERQQESLGERSARKQEALPLTEAVAQLEHG